MYFKNWTTAVLMGGFLLSTTYGLAQAEKHPTTPVGQRPNDVAEQRWVAEAETGLQEVELIWSDPPNLFVDVRQDRDVDGEQQGIAEVQLLFNQPVVLTVEELQVVSTAEEAPAAVDVYGADESWIVLLNRPLIAGERIMLSFGMPNVSLQFASRPADVNLDGTSNQADVRALEAAVIARHTGQIDRFDIDRNGLVDAADVTRLAELLDGSDGKTAWRDAGFAVDPVRCCCGPLGECYVTTNTKCNGGTTEIGCPCHPDPCPEVP